MSILGWSIDYKNFFLEKFKNFFKGGVFWKKYKNFFQGIFFFETWAGKYPILLHSLY